MKTYEPPNGLDQFARVLQRCSIPDAVALLALAFDDCAAHAVLQDYRLRAAAPRLLAACKQALETAETGRALDWTALTAAVDQAETAEVPVA